MGICILRVLSCKDNLRQAREKCESLELKNLEL